MPRALWTGAISFGLIFIPVSLKSAEAPDELDLTLLDKRDFAPVGYKRVNKTTGKEVAWDDIIKGYEHEPDQYVALSEKDFRKANVAATQTIDLLAFVEQSDIDPIYFEKPYYLVPGKRGEKVYALLRDSLKQSGKVGVAQIVIRVKQHLAVVAAVDDALVLNTLRYPQEIKSVASLELPAAAVGTELTTKEIAMAVALIESMSEPWQPSQYRDQYRDDLLKLIRQKIKAHQIHSVSPADDEPENAEAEAPAADVIDLMALLKKSLPKTAEAAASARSSTTQTGKARASAKTRAKAA
ncbi:Ku protein [Silvimonas sp.]|uniref:non-homologous end joining protein Ku n=1 Tax=Silvimonas sp. TaxID=2650811 RepID=UPI00284BDFAE|nr:Ku protein [Silvimonas sp.]MDR3427168.1 Ku protein [Silvimonas sp.]